MKSREGLLNAVFLGGTVLSWSAYYLLSKWAVDDLSSPYLAGLFLRLAAFVFLTVYMLVRRQFKMLFSGGLKAAVILFAIGTLGYLLDLFANIGFQNGSVSTGTVLLKTDILMGNLVSVLLIKERLSVLDWIASLIMLAGVVLVLDIDFENLRLNWHDLFFIASAAAVTANAFIIKHAQAKLGQDSDKIAYFNNFTVMLLFLVSALIAGDFKTAALGEKPYWFWLLILAGGLAQTLIYMFYYRCLKRNPVWKVKVYLLFVPVISCIAGALIFGESFGTLKVVGIAVVLFGALMILTKDKLKRKTKKTDKCDDPDDGERCYIDSK